MKLTGVLLLAVACIVAVTAAPPPEKVDEVVQALKDVRHRLEEEMETLDELVAEAEAEEEEPAEEEERSLQGERGWGGQFTCGGSSGRQQWSDEAYAKYGRITAFKIWHERVACYIQGVQFRYGHTWAPVHNGKRKAEVEVDLAPDEYIEGVQMDKRNEWGTEVVCKITIHTNKRVYGPYCGYRCDNHRCGYTEWGNFRYVSGRHGGTLDSLTFHEWYD